MSRRIELTEAELRLALVYVGKVSHGELAREQALRVALPTGGGHGDTMLIVYVEPSPPQTLPGDGRL